MLTLVLLYSVIGSIWAAIFLSHILTRPIADLTQGTKAIAAGNYETEISQQSNDDLGLLIISFNEMTKQIDASTKKIKSQRDYLNILMKQLSSGLISISERAASVYLRTLRFLIYSELKEPILLINLLTH